MAQTPGSSGERQAGQAEPGRGAYQPSFTEGARLWNEALEAQLAQWQSSIDRLGRGRYGPLDAARDVQDSWQRAAGLYSRLASLWWRGWMDAGRAAWPDWRGGWCGWPGTAGQPTAAPANEPSSGPIPGGPAGTRPPATPAGQPAPPAEAPAPAAEPAARQRDTASAGGEAKRAKPTRRAKRRSPSALARAESFLREQLAGGERPAQELLRRAAEAGLSETTLRRARKSIGAKTRRVGFGRESQVFWGPPES